MFTCPFSSDEWHISRSVFTGTFTFIKLRAVACSDCRILSRIRENCQIRGNRHWFDHFHVTENIPDPYLCNQCCDEYDTTNDHCTSFQWRFVFLKISLWGFTNFHKLKFEIVSPMIHCKSPHLSIFFSLYAYLLFASVAITFRSFSHHLQPTSSKDTGS